LHGLQLKTAIVTGANAGLGLGCSAALLDAGWQVVLAVRDPARGHAAAQALGHPDRCTVVELDLASLDSVRRFVATGWDVDAIVCNAGMQLTSDTPVLTADGIEMTFAVNHLGHFALVTGLLDRQRDGARVVVVASDTHDPAQRTGMPAPEYTSAERLAHPPAGERIPGRRRYTTSKLCNVLFAYELARRAPQLRVNAFNPGLMPGSGLARDASRVQQFAWKRIMPALRFLPQVRSTRSSGRVLAALVTDGDASGRYVNGRKQIASSRDSYDEAKARDLWDTSSALAAQPA
jgi:NAD(P)-dependent dehydrogenase (short-subunit alcohol dehydrogenase family)